MLRPLAFTLGLCGALGVARAAEPELDRLKHHVATLASPEYLGRRDAGAAKARDYLLSEFARLKLQPLFGDSYRQDVTGDDGARVLGVNVGGFLPPTDPKFADEWIILGVHYDHLGVEDGAIYPGADDNATGVAMMLEVARSVVESPATPRRGILFVGFDLEERGPNGEFGLRGSQFFARHPPRPLDRVRLFVTADMIGRALGGVCREDVFVLGSEREPGVRPWVARAAAGQPVRVNLLGSDVLVIDRSDYGPFRARQVPYLFFTTGENPLYHSPRDVAATIDYPKFAAISRIMAGVVRAAAEADSVPGWAEPPDYPLAEAEAFGRIFRTLLDHRGPLKIGAIPAGLLRQGVETASAAVARGAMTEADRKSLVRTAQIVLFTVF